MNLCSILLDTDSDLIAAKPVEIILDLDENVKKESADSECEDKKSEPDTSSAPKVPVEPENTAPLTMDIDPHHRELQEQAKLFSKCNTEEEAAAIAPPPVKSKCKLNQYWDLIVLCFFPFPVFCIIKFPQYILGTTYYVLRHPFIISSPIIIFSYFLKIYSINVAFSKWVYHFLLPRGCCEYDPFILRSYRLNCVYRY